MLILRIDLVVIAIDKAKDYNISLIEDGTAKLLAIC